MPELEEITNEASEQVIEEEITVQSEQPADSKYVKGQELYDMIVANPEYRVVLDGSLGKDWMRPLAFVFSNAAFQFQEDAACTIMHPNGMCQEVIDLCGIDGCPETMSQAEVRIGDLYIDNWETGYARVEKIRKQPDAQWIRLYLAE